MDKKQLEAEAKRLAGEKVPPGGVCRCWFHRDWTRSEHADRIPPPVYERLCGNIDEYLDDPDQGNYGAKIFVDEESAKHQLYLAYLSCLEDGTLSVQSNCDARPSEDSDLDEQIADLEWRIKDFQKVKPTTTDRLVAYSMLPAILLGALAFVIGLIATWASPIWIVALLIWWLS